MEWTPDATVPFVLRDHDAKFSRSFDEVFRSHGGEVLVTPVRAPKANAYAERWIRTVRAECLDWLLILGRNHLDQVLRVYVQHYNGHRPHRALGLQAPDSPARPTIPREDHGRHSASTRPARRFASRVPASCMNAFAHPSGLLRGPPSRRRLHASPCRRPTDKVVLGENQQGRVRRHYLLGGLLHEYRSAA